MTFDQHANFVSTAILTPPTPATTGTTITVNTGQGAIFPVPPFNCSVFPTGVFPTHLNTEIVRVTDITGDVLTIDRAQEGTYNRNIVAGDIIVVTVTAKTLTDIEDALTSISTTGLQLYDTGLGQMVTITCHNGILQVS